MEVICLVAETLQLVPQLGELPVPPVEGVEPLLDTDQLSAWTGWSRTTIYNYRTRAANPLPSIGGTTTRRYLPSEVIDWLRDESARANAPE
jgi:predicted DNA-binding transcriptional regulator AlpA